MHLAAYRLRATVAGRWRGWAVVVVLLGVTLGVCFTSLAGARRTQSAYPRFLRWGNASTMSLTGGSLDDAEVEAQVARIPEVVSSTSYVAFQSNVLVDGRPDFSQNFEPTGTYNGRFFTSDRFAATSGRTPDPTKVGEVAVNEYAAKQFGYRVGQRFELGTYAPLATPDPTFYTDPPPPALRTAVTIVGIGLFPDEVVQDEGDRTTRMLLTPAFSRAADGLAIYSLQGVTLRNGDRDVDAVKARYTALVPPGTAVFKVTSTDEFHALSAMRPLSIALGLFGVISGVAGLLLVGQAIGRMMRLERRELAVLRAMGATPRSLAASVLAAPLIAIVAGTVLAVLIAVLASPVMPLGPVHRVEVAPGFDVDLTVLVGGSLVVLLLLGTAALLVARAELPHRIAARDAGPARGSRLVAASAAAGAGAPAVVGLRFALERPDANTAVAVRSVIPSATVAIVALLAAITFGSSLDTLVSKPVLWGWGWEVTALDANGYGNIDRAKAAAVLDRDPRIAAWSGGYFGTDTIDGRDVPLLGMAAGSTVLPPIQRGRAPRNRAEVVLGTGTAGQLGVTVGDTVRIGAGARRLTVVGLATLPTIGIIHGAHPSLGVGALVVPELVPGYDRDLTTVQVGTFGPNALFVKLVHPRDAAAVTADLGRRLAPAADFGGLAVLAPQRPAEIVNSRSIGTAPAVLAGALALGAMLSLGLALAASVRRRARDLALLRCLGFTRRQLAATVRWQAVSTVAVSLAIGLPVGVAVGRWSWIGFARRLGVVPRATVAPLSVLGVALLVLVVANLAAAAPARWAAHTAAADRATGD